MKKSYIFVISAFLLSLFIFSETYAQKEIPPAGYEKLTPLSVKDSIELANLPRLILPESFKGPDAPLLPYIVDNSQNMHWRPVFAQVAYECGQASGIGQGFTYAINRLRNLPSDDPDNQYPTHFCWNFGNGGDGWYGVSYFHSFEIVRTEGTPNVTTYGGMSAGGPKRWMNGYDNYYQAMHNRIAEAYQIDVSTEEGILTIRNWIHNHIENADVGGVASFYTSCPYGMSTLPTGTPEAGMYVMTSWGGANHALTVSGYHDSICWDYNNDGQYTNHIDINGDGEVNVRDWEIGGLRFANNYSGGPTWGNNGFCYMTYKSLADPPGNGGIWNNALHVLYAKAGTEPLLTTRVILKHDMREMIRVQVGISTDITSETPQYVLGFPIFNYQGGNYYMQGGTSEEDKTIEFGLDITPFLNLIEPGTPARYFLMVNENDPNTWGTGEIISYSIIDYTNGVNEIICDQSNVNITNNNLTTLWVNHTVDYGSVMIDMDTLPPATMFEPYSCQLSASGGTEPYLWDFDLNFTETNYTQTFPMVNAQQLTPSNNDDGYALKQLDFTFPFYGEEYDEVRVNVDGTIMFEDYFNWPYTVYDFFTFTKNKHIAPFNTDLRIYPSGNDGMWYEGDTNFAIFRWKVSVNGQQGTSELNFAVQLFKNGDIRFFYGNVNIYSGIEWLSGVSAGDNKYYQFTEVTNDPSITPEFVCDLEASHYPEGFEISRYGVFSGTTNEIYNNFKIKFMVTDENNLKDSKVLLFSTDGSNYLVIDDYSVIAGGDDMIEYGEKAFLTVDIKSLSEEIITGAGMTLSIDDEFITLLDSSEILGSFDPGEIRTFTNAFTFNVGNLVPNGHNLDFSTLITDDSGGEWASHIYLTAYAPEISAGGVTVDDGGNSSLDPGETADLIVTLMNDGGATANNIVATLFSSDPYVTINDNTGNINILSPYNNDTVTFNVTASAYIPIGYIIEFTIDIAADLGITNTDTFDLVIGQTPIVIIDVDPNHSSGPIIQTAIEANGVLVEYTTSFPADMNQYSAIFVCLGIYSDNYILSSSEGQELANYLNNGGNLYMEGGDTWAYDNQTAAHAMFNINGTDDGTSDMSQVLGQTGTFTEGMSFIYSGENDWMDHIEPIVPAFLVLENESPSYGTGIAYDEGTYKTIGTAHEFGGLTDGTSISTKKELMKQYLDFYGLLPPPVYTLNLKVYLEGPFNGTEMKTDLNTQDLIPSVQSYNVNPWYYDGTENIVTIPNSDIVDWVLVEFRDAPDAISATPGTMIARHAAFLLNDGSVVGLDGSSSLYFSNTINYQLFIVIWHRNHLGVLSANALSGFNGVYNYDFTVSEDKVYGGNLAHKEIAPGIWGLIAGDGNCDGQITIPDKTNVWSQQAGEAMYEFGDFNMDGNIDNKDKDDLLILNIGMGYTGQVLP